MKRERRSTRVFARLPEREHGHGAPRMNSDLEIYPTVDPRVGVQCANVRPLGEGVGEEHDRRAGGET